MLKGSAANLRNIYGWRDECAKGRTIALISALLTSFYNVFITGVFYTGFLSMYQIDLVGLGIISFIGPLGYCLSLFSPMVLERIQKRKWFLVGAKVFYYFMVIIATNLMPLLVEEPARRVVWFGILQFAATAVYSIFSPGFTPWFYHFYPQDDGQRAAYLSYNQIFSSVLSGCILLLSSVLATLVNHSGHQETLILGMRYFAFALVLVDVAFQVQAKEYPYPVDKEQIRLRNVFTLPFRYPKFMRCLLLLFGWSFVATLNSGTWDYYLLKNIGFSYTTLNLPSVIYMVEVVLLMPFWRRLVGKLGWVRTFGLGVLLWVPTEVYFFFLTPDTSWMFIPGVMVQKVFLVGVALSMANILYLNMPEKNVATHTCFYTVFNALFGSLGTLAGTMWCSWFGESRVLYLGALPTTAVQYTCMFRAIGLLLLGIMAFCFWRAFTPDVHQEAATAEA